MKNVKPSTSSSDVSVAVSNYEVFLSFRGSDTRKRFADHLYTSLKTAGIHVFRDSEELRVGKEIGENILKAIKKSKICIPIFSKDYASSKWCLMEVAHMWKCKSRVLPIFYDATPHQVRHQSGTYAKAFKEHYNRRDKKTVEEWRNALAKIGALKGWELQNEANGHEGALVKRVVSEVLRKLKKAPLVGNDNLSGLEGLAGEVIRGINGGGHGVRIVLPLTTFAKTVYGQLSEGFEYCKMRVRRIRIKHGEIEPKKGNFSKHKSFEKHNQRQKYARDRHEVAEAAPNDRQRARYHRVMS